MQVQSEGSGHEIYPKCQWKKCNVDSRHDVRFLEGGPDPNTMLVTPLRLL